MKARGPVGGVSTWYAPEVGTDGWRDTDCSENLFAVRKPRLVHHVMSLIKKVIKIEAGLLVQRTLMAGKC